MSWWPQIGRAIMPIFGAPGAGGSIPNPALLAEFLAVAAEFWREIAVENLVAATAAFDRCVLLAQQLPGVGRIIGEMRRMEFALVELDALLAGVAEGGAEAAATTLGEAGAGFVLGEGGMILLIALFGLWALRGGGAGTAYAAGGGGGYGPIREQAHPVYSEAQWQRIIEQPNGWRTLIVGPPPVRRPTASMRLGAQVMLSRSRAFARGEIQGPVHVR